MKKYDESENWNNKGELYQAFVALMELSVKQNIPIICHIAIQANDDGYHLTGGINKRNENDGGWLPQTFTNMYDIVNMDNEGKSFITDAIGMARSNMARNEAYALSAQIEKEVSDARKDN